MTFFSDAPADVGIDSSASRHGTDIASKDERRSRLGWALVGIALLIVLALAFAPSSYVIETPGPVYDTLGVSGDDDVPLITIPDETNYPTSGSLDLLTVSVLGNPDAGASLFDVAVSWFDPSHAVVPVEAVYPTGVTSDQQREASRVQMENSQREAVAAALTELGYEFSRTVAVVSLAEGSASNGVLESGDVITSIDGVRVDGLSDLREKVEAHGTDSPAQVGIDRGGDARVVKVTPREQNGSIVLGVGVQVDYAFPFEVQIELENVGGPSAGMMFALGIYDKLTPGELTGGAKIAGTGTIDGDGDVGPIGGIRQKLYGAQGAGATLFLAPAENCEEVVGHIPDGLDVVAVATLDDAISAVEAVADGTDPATLPSCDAG